MLQYDGSPSSVSGQGAPYDTVSITQVDVDTLTWDTKKTGGKYHSHGRILVSPMESHDVDFERHRCRWESDDGRFGLRHTVVIEP